jgi:hypothetical protein
MSEGSLVPSAAAPFVAQLRTRGPGHDLSAGAPDRFEIRAQVHEAWDAVRLVVTAHTPMAHVKRAALAALLADDGDSDSYVAKVHGAEVHDEGRPLSECGVRAGTTVFVHARRRRAVR